MFHWRGLRISSFSSPLVEPFLEVQPDVFPGCSAPKVQLVGGAESFGLGAPEIDAAVVLAMLVDLVLQAQVEVLVASFAD